MDNHNNIGKVLNSGMGKVIIKADDSNCSDCGGCIFDLDGYCALEDNLCKVDMEKYDICGTRPTYKFYPHLGKESKEPEFTPCTNYEDLPEGCHLVKLDNQRNPYQVAYVSVNDSGHKFIVVGNHFHWDAKPLLSYKTLEV